MNRWLVDAYRFFREYAGYVVGRRAECAFSLARAELEAEARGWRVEWEPEWEAWDGDEPLPPDAELLCAVLRDEQGSVLGSLGMVALMPRDPYARVVAAELASEALDNEASCATAQAL